MALNTLGYRTIKGMTKKKTNKKTKTKSIHETLIKRKLLCIIFSVKRNTVQMPNYI